MTVAPRFQISADLVRPPACLTDPDLWMSVLAPHSGDDLLFKWSHFTLSVVTAWAVVILFRRS